MPKVIPDLSNEVAARFDGYPAKVRTRMLELRALVFDVAEESSIDSLEETLKWGEPSYIAKGGTTLRMDWKASNPDKCSLFFHCQTHLLASFREIYPDVFEYDGKRAIHLGITGRYQKSALKHCIQLALTYHKVKHLPPIS